MLDSIADAQALDSLDAIAPGDSMPGLALDSTPTWDLNVTDFTTQPRVRYFLDYFTGKAHDRFQIWLDRLPRYEGFIRERLGSYQLPGDLVYLGLIESGLSSQAVSRAKAVGMWQFMAGTGRAYGLEIDQWADERRDPVRATEAAAHHLADLTSRFGSTYLAAAAYNAGAGRVGRSLDRIGANTDADEDSLDLSSDEAFFSLADTRLLKAETRDYVPKLIAAALIAKEPQKYGFTLADSVRPFPLDSVIVDGGTGLDLIARLGDTTMDALRELNPHLLKLVAPPTVARYAVRVPAGTHARIQAAYDSLAPRDRHAVTMHRVESGETVAEIARRYAVTAESIKAANRSARAGKLKAGTTLVVPLPSSLPLSLFREPDAATHVVRRGETLGGIANRYRVSVASLRAANHLGKSSLIRVGQRLVISGSAASTTGTSRSSTRVATTSRQAKTHVVRSGETVGEIAEQYHVSQAALIRVNGLGRRAVIRVGQRLRIPS